MSDATTGVAQANARVSTIPKLSPPSEGASERLGRAEEVGERVLREEPDDVDPVVGHAEPGEQEPHGERVGARHDEPRPGASADLRPRAEQHMEALARLVAAREDDRVLAAARVGLLGDQDAVRDDLPRAAEPRARPSRARARETAMRWSTRSIRKPHAGIPRRIQPRSPEAWWVATIGSVASARTATQIAGVIGSWRWSTSNRSRSSTRRMRKNDRGLSTMFGSEPFAGTITERPTGMTFGGRVSVPADARVERTGELARRVVAHHEPARRARGASSAAAWSSACSTTAPQNDHENGTTMPIFTPGAYKSLATRARGVRPQWPASGGFTRVRDDALPGVGERSQLVVVEAARNRCADAGDERRARRR